MKRKRLLNGVLKVLLGVVGLLLVVLWMLNPLADRVAPDAFVERPERARVEDAEWFTVQSELIPRYVYVTGTVTSENKVRLSARLSAYVAETHVSAGDAVQRDEVLVQLDDREIRAQLEVAHAAYRQANAEHERLKRLYARLAATEQQLVAAEAAYNTARAKVDQAAAALTHTTIRAPFTGVVADRHVDPGSLANPGEPLVTVYDTETMRLDAPVPVRLVDYLHIGDPVQVRLERPRMPVGGTIHRVVNEIDPYTRTQTVQVTLDIKDGAILPGTFGRLELALSEHPALRIPVRAIRQVGQLQQVHVANADGEPIRRMITTGPVRDGRVEVLSGLRDGEQVWVPHMELPL